MSTLFFYHTERIFKRQCASVRLQCPGRKTKHGKRGLRRRSKQKALPGIPAGHKGGEVKTA
jgi:hypothetical protein